jgi:hypothetical protein
VCRLGAGAACATVKRHRRIAEMRILMLKGDVGKCEEADVDHSLAYNSQKGFHTGNVQIFQLRLSSGDLIPVLTIFESFPYNIPRSC